MQQTVRSVHKEMDNIGVVFEVLEDDQPTPVRWTKASGHIMWDIKRLLLGRQFRYKMGVICQIQRKVTFLVLSLEIVLKFPLLMLI